MKCSQTGEQHIVKLKDLSKEDNQPILNDDLFEGSSLLIERNHKTYPVEFVKFKGLIYVYSRDPIKVICISGIHASF